MLKKTLATILKERTDKKSYDQEYIKSCRDRSSWLQETDTVKYMNEVRGYDSDNIIGHGNELKDAG